jgi:hypothetical protein
MLLAAILVCSSSCNFYRRITGRKKTAAADSSLAVATDSLAIKKDSTAIALDSNAKTDSPVVVSIPQDSAQQALLSSLLPYWNNRIAWNTFNGKAKAHFEGKGESPDFTANIRMAHDKAIWVSVSVLIIGEVARVYITPDTIQVLDRLHKTVQILPFSESSNLLPIHADFASLQSLIIGEVLPSAHQPNFAQDTANAFILGYSSPDFSQSAQFDKPDTSLHYQAIASQGATMVSEYTNWTSINNRRFANNRNLTMNDKGEPYMLSLEFNRAAFDEAVEMPLSIPDKYERK